MAILRVGQDEGRHMAQTGPRRVTLRPGGFWLSMSSEPHRTDDHSRSFYLREKENALLHSSQEHMENAAGSLPPTVGVY